MDSPKNGSGINPFKIFSMLWVKRHGMVEYKTT
jgi:hypothetical protein